MAKGDGFELTVRVEIVKVNTDNGTGYASRTGERLSIDETLPLGSATSFLEVAQILGRFHELARTLSERAQAGIGAG